MRGEEAPGWRGLAAPRHPCGAERCAKQGRLGSGDVGILTMSDDLGEACALSARRAEVRQRSRNTSQRPSVSSRPRAVAVMLVAFRVNSPL
jgi:hypothetical protein